MSVDSAVAAFARAHLPPPPARVLEVGAGDGALAQLLRDGGYDVTAVDPANHAPGVLPVALLDVVAPPASFDAALAVVSLHHVEPLAESFAVLADVLRAGAPFVVDEIDVDLLDERAEAWWLEQRRSLGRGEPNGSFAELRTHLHPLDRIRDVLGAWFDTGAALRVPYLYRWGLDPALRVEEEELIGCGALPAVGARFVAVRRAG